MQLGHLANYHETHGAWEEVSLYQKDTLLPAMTMRSDACQRILSRRIFFLLSIKSLETSWNKH